jgi:alpha-methylacyl-CoA racemase
MMETRADNHERRGPLHGVRVVELAGIGPAPFCAMLLADHGAEVVRVDRAAHVPDRAPDGASRDAMHRGRPSLAVDLKNPEGVAVVLDLAARADVLVEGFRPGVMERLGLGPEVCHERNPGLVYGRMTGWGQDGPWARAAGHDINYIALAGALGATGRRGEAPVPPANFLGDFGGGGLVLAFGIVAALLERQASGRGQVVDAAVVDGAALLTTMVYGLMELGVWSATAGENIADTGAHFYDVYETADGRYVSLGAVEPKFYEELVRGLGLDPDQLPAQLDRSSWAALKPVVARAVRSRTLAEWEERLGGTDACFAPVLTPSDAWRHPHNRARATFVEHAGVRQPAPAPRLSRTPARLGRGPAHPGEHTAETLAGWGFSADQIDALHASGAVRSLPPSGEPG